jgi:hypothetical protein
MLQKFIILSVAFLLAGCSTIASWIPDKFDNVEYERLVQLNVTVDMVSGCDQDNIQDMLYNSRILKKYSQGTLGKDASVVYAEINSLVEEMNNRENPSVVYCELKRKNIRTLTEKAIDIYGNRLK